MTTNTKSNGPGNLKMSPNHYETIYQALAAAIADKPDAWKSYKDNGASHKRFRRDAFRFARIDTDSIRWQCDRLYPYLNDSHIDNALRRIMRELGQPEW